MTKLKTVNIKGKEYDEDNERLKYFRANYKGWCMSTDIVELSDDRCTFKATIFDEAGNIRATGHAQEKEGSSFILISGPSGFSTFFVSPDRTVSPLNLPVKVP